MKRAMQDDGNRGKRPQGARVAARARATARDVVMSSPPETEPPETERPYDTRGGLRGSFMGSRYIWDDLCSFFNKTRINLRWAGVAEKLPDYLEKR
jgi:hypothetical protein